MPELVYIDVLKTVPPMYITLRRRYELLRRGIGIFHKTASKGIAVFFGFFVGGA